jgi:hypothetical protein
MPEPKTTREKLTVSIDPPVRDALKRHADELDITPAAYARQTSCPHGRARRLHRSAPREHRL